MAYQYASELTVDHQVSVIVPRYHPGMSYQRTPGVNVEAVRPLMSFGNAAYLPRLVQRLAEFEVVHLHYPFFGVHERLAKLSFRQKLVVSYHMTPSAPGWKGKVFAWDMKRYAPRLAARADLVLAATQDYLEAEAKPAFGAGAKWRVLPYGVGEAYHPGPRPENLERELRLRYGEQVVLFVGTLDAAHAFKGLDVLLQAMSRLPQDISARLVVVGGGGRRKRFEQEARRLRVHKQVHFAGYVPEAELPDYYRLADLFVFPSTSKAEAFGLVALQAMATGVPVVASRLAGVRELIRHGETGVLVPPQDDLALAAALEQLLRNPHEARSLGQRGGELAEQRYRWRIIGQELRELYRQLT